MQLKYCILIIGPFFLLSGCKEDASKFRVKTRYHISKFSFDGHEQVSGGTTDTFYYTADGKRDYSASGTTTTETRNGNMLIATTTHKNGKVAGTPTSLINDKGLEESIVIRDATHVTYIHKYIYDSNGFVVEDRYYQQQPPDMVWKYKVVDGNRVEEHAINTPSV